MENGKRHGIQPREYASLRGILPTAELMRWISTTVLIQAAEDIDLDAEPESGEAGWSASIEKEVEAFEPQPQDPDLEEE